MTPSSHVPPGPGEYEEQTQGVVAQPGLDPTVLKNGLTDTQRKKLKRRGATRTLKHAQGKGGSLEDTSGDPHQTTRQAGMGPDCKRLLASPRGWCLKGPGPLAPESAAVRGRGQGVKGGGSALSPLTQSRQIQRDVHSAATHIQTGSSLHTDVCVDSSWCKKCVSSGAGVTHTQASFSVNTHQIMANSSSEQPAAFWICGSDVSL